ncbi:preprotein translocase subunit YajC [Asanoa siamensis]|uniref:Preprotein translocase subunit YajC n=1 Tax=Asanoa siamensis TaxID=926357 RepID=A0ABQ4CJR0_9ACTN|nr:preprotein translocase subunit YajC [Asanoa siamensis]GIF71523.1 preprotein translocase subunit YajC [Asanoa siamensis]
MLAAQSSGGGGFLPLLMIVLLFGVMYFMMIRPQQKRRREAQQMQSTLGAGSEVVTIGGLYGTVVETDTETVTLEAAPGVHVRYARQAVARVISAKNEVPEPAEAPEVETIKSPVEPAKD